MNTIDGLVPESNAGHSNLRAIFEILSYLHLDAERDGHPELAERLEFAMNHAESKLATLKTAKTVPPVSSSGH